MSKLKEGWQMEKNHAQKVYHYIGEDTFSLCGKLGFYQGDLGLDKKGMRSKKDCKSCIKKLDKRKNKVDLKTTKKDFKIINKIIKRVGEIIPKGSFDGLCLSMDLSAAHNDCPLDLERLFEAGNTNFLHDVFGISKHMDRNTGKLDPTFLPRFAKKVKAK